MTHGVPPKKTLILNILDILKKHSDADHRLSAKDIGVLLAQEYGQQVDRKAIRRNLSSLQELGYDIECTETVRTNGRGEQETILTGWYINRTFTDAELRLLIDSLLFSKVLTGGQRREIIGKLEGLSSSHFRTKVRHIRSLPEGLPENKQVFLTIELLDEAITEGKQVSFHYAEYGPDKKARPRKSRDGTRDETYAVSPYQMAAANGRYYLICNRTGYPRVSHYRVDRMIDVQLLDAAITPLETLTGYERGLDLPRHMAEHVYMFAGESVPVTFAAGRALLGDVMDWFGHEVRIEEADGKGVHVHVRVNENAMFYWALQYAEHVEVLQPESLRGRLGAAARAMATKYVD